MCCWTTNEELVEHKWETGETVIYNGEPATVVQVFPVKKGEVTRITPSSQKAARKFASRKKNSNP